MRLAIVSDIHGNLPALEAVIADFAELGVDGIVNLGDIVSGPLWPAETADRLMALNWPTLAGNHERQVLQPIDERMSASDRHAAERLTERHRSWLAALPKHLDLPGGLHCCHGTPTSDLHYFIETVTDDFGHGASRGLRVATADELHDRAAGMRAALILCGHSHVARDVKLDDGLHVANPGSVGLQAYDDDHPHVHHVEAGTPHARYALIEQQASGWHVALRAVPYDWESAARQAERNGRADWAFALRTGRVGAT